MAKARKKNSFRRKQAKRSPYKIVLNPSTKVYKLVEDLKILKKANQLRPYNNPK